MFTSPTKLFQSITPAVSTGAYQISRSLRFNSADSAYLNRTPASAGNLKTWTWSGWVKRSAIGVYGYIFDTSPAVNQEASLRFNDNNTLQFYQYNASTIYDRTTTQVFRDPSAWYHIVLAFDTTQATASNRIKLYVNGVQVTAFSSSTDPSLNLDGFINNTTAHAIGRSQNSSSNYLNGYMTEINFIDGQALTPSSFGQTDSATGVWNPIAYTGTYGTNGFYVNFSDNSNTTAATLGKDYSPNGNNWTPNNFSVTAGVGNDSLVDSPTNYGTDTGAGGEVRGNYATLNPLDNGGNTLADGNLSGSKGGSPWASTRATLAFPTSGKWYWEAQITAGGNNMTIGIANSAAVLAGDIIGRDANGWGYVSGNGQKWTNGSGAGYGATWTAGDIMGIAFDADAGTLTFYKNNSSQGTAFTGLTIGPYFPGVSFESSTGYVNFGQRPFVYTAPSGFKALVTQNLPTPTVGATSGTLASAYMLPVIYTGNSSTQTITTGFQPDFVWIKSRSTADVHTLQDVIRGARYYLISNSTAAEATQADSDGISAFTSTGFTLGYTDSDAWNKSPNTYVSWNWKAGGTGVSNTNGSITSNVSVSTTAGFSVVTYTGNGTSGATVGHGIGSAPAMFIVKRTNSTENWCTYHKSLGATKALFLNLTDAQNTSSAFFNDTNPTSSLFSLGNNASVNASGSTYVAYCFAEVAGFSKIGSYVGNNSADGPFVYCGFRPRFIMGRDATGVDNWWIYDTARNTYNVANSFLRPNLADAEGSNATDVMDILSNGFKIRGASNFLNENSNTFIFMAFAEAPFNYSRAR
jgi:hypothetical protein